MTNNEARALSEIVSIDAWHAEFDESGKASVHVDASFFIGLIGAEDHFEITFKVALRRAVLRLVIPPTEPLTPIQSSIDREQTAEGILKIVSATNLGGGASIGIDASSNAIPLRAHASGNAFANKTHSSTSELSQSISRFETRQFKDGSGNYCWEITGRDGTILEGKVWDPVKNPRMKVKRTSSPKISPVMYVQVLCRRCDIEIDKVTPKSGSPFYNRFSSNRMAAARAVIKEKILGNGLNHPEADNELIEIQIAESVIYPEVG